MKAANLLLLLPHCLQRTECGEKVQADVNRCKRCGQCRIAGLLELRDRYGIQCAVASGGREAVNIVRRKDVKAVVAVACEKELVEGIRGAFPKPVLAVCNTRPRGPCRHTEVDISRVEAAIEELLLK